MNKTKDFFRNNKKILIIFLIILIEISIPLFIKGLFLGDDCEYHLSRIDSLSKSIQNGEFPVKIHSALANTYGYGNGFFYSNFFLYIPAMFEIFGLNLILSYEIFIGLILVLLVLLSYFSLKEIIGDKDSAIIGTIIVVLSRAVFMNIYYRFALGESLGYMFILPALAGMYNYVHNDFNKPIYLIIGFCGLLYSHIITTIVVTGFCFLYFLINIKSTLKDYKKFGKLVLVGIIILLLTSAFWMPMVEQYFSQEFRLSKPWQDISTDEYGITNLLGSDVHSAGYLVTVLLPFVIYSLISKKVDKKYKIYSVFLLIAIILLGCKIFWKLKYVYNIVNILQFKFRLVGPITILTAISFSSLANSLKSKINIKYVLIGVTIISCLFMGIYLRSLIGETSIRVKQISGVNKLLYRDANSLGGGQEYLPINCDYTYCQYPDKAMYSSREQIDVEKNGLTCEVTKDKEGKDFIDMPLVYYKGYCAEMITDNNQKIQLDVAEAEIGLVRVNVPEEKGKIKVYYKGTITQKISYILTLISFICVIAYLPVKKYFLNRNKK